MKTFLQEFIDKKMSTYTPPANKREGGLSAQKYRATLLFLTNDRQDNIAKKVRVSYGLLRKWRTEDKFWQTINDHYKEFLTKIVIELEKGKIERFSDLANYNKIVTEYLDFFTSVDGYPKTPELFDENLYFVAKKTLLDAMQKYFPPDSFVEEKRRVRDSLISDKIGCLMGDIVNLDIDVQTKKKMRDELSGISDLLFGERNAKKDLERLQKSAELLGL